MCWRCDVALITPEQARESIPELTGTTSNTLLTTLITQADALMAAWCLWPGVDDTVSPTLEQTTYTEFLDGPDELRPRELQLPNAYAVSSITSIHDASTLVYDSGTLVASGDYTLDERSGKVFLDPDATHGAWSTGRRHIKVIYVCGWADTAAPEFVKSAAKHMVRHLLDLPQRQGVSTTEDGQQHREEGIPELVKVLLGPIKIWENAVG